MPKYIALYRGLNVLGRNSVKMEALRALHERLGQREVKSYIQSGNVVFAAKGTNNAIARRLAAEFEKEFGFAAKLVVVDALRWQALVRENPYAKASKGNPRLVHVGVCDGAPSGSTLKALLAKTGGREQFKLAEQLVYLHAPDGFGASKFAAGMEKASGVPMTMRNWRTVLALWEMVRDAAG